MSVESRTHAPITGLIIVEGIAAAGAISGHVDTALLIGAGGLVGQCLFDAAIQVGRIRDERKSKPKAPQDST